jgi:hypothetical protein
MSTPPAGRHARPLLVALLALAVVARAAPPAAAQAGGAPDVTYQPPVDAPVAEPFRAPAHRYGPGNRGLTYDLADHTPVRAAADGTVVFAGPVAGTRHVTVLHADGLRTSYSFLSEVLVRRGDAVRRGDLVGLAGAGFHLGARDGDAYVDPAALFDASVVRVRLVAHGEPLPPTDAGLLAEQAALRELARAERPGLLARAVGAVGRWAAPVATRWFDVAAAGWHTWEQLTPLELVGGAVQSVRRHLSQDCTPGDHEVAPPVEERTAVLVAGLGSSSEHGAIDDLDLAALGYAPSGTIRFSYAGGRTPEPGTLHPGLAGIPEAPYAPDDTLQDITERGRELATLIEQAAAARPGVPVDVYAHSMGGLVTRVALRELATRPGGLEALGQVVTIGTPHSGADLATLAVIAEQNFATNIAQLDHMLGVELPIDPFATSVDQMAESSAFIDQLRGDGVPDGVRFRTVAARGDLVVAADKADVDGHPAAIIDDVGIDAHGALPSDPQTTRELLLGLHGLPPACQSLLDAVADGVVPEVVQGVTDGVALGTGL